MVQPINELPIEQLIERQNCRSNLGDLSGLIESIRQDGIIEPLIVRPSGANHEVICGHRRLAAARELKIAKVPVVVRDMTDEQARWTALIENVQRESLPPMDEAKAFSLMAATGPTGLTDEEIAARVGAAVYYIRRRRSLLNLHDDLQAKVGKEISLGVAQELARIRDHKIQKQIARQVDHNTGVADIRHVVSVELAPYSLKRAPWPLDRALAEKPACKACAAHQGVQMKIFDFDDRDVREKLTCFEPTCFKIKNRAWSDMLIADAKEHGKKILTQQEFDALDPKTRESFAYREEFEECRNCSDGHVLLTDDHILVGTGCLNKKCYTLRSQISLGLTQEASIEAQEKEKVEKQRKKDIETILHLRLAGKQKIAKAYLDSGSATPPAYPALIAEQLARLVSPEMLEAAYIAALDEAPISTVYHTLFSVLLTKTEQEVWAIILELITMQISFMSEGKLDEILATDSEESFLYRTYEDSDALEAVKKLGKESIGIIASQLGVAETKGNLKKDVIKVLTETPKKLVLIDTILRTGDYPKASILRKKEDSATIATTED